MPASHLVKDVDFSIKSLSVTMLIGQFTASIELLWLWFHIERQVPPTLDGSGESPTSLSCFICFSWAGTVA